MAPGAQVFGHPDHGVGYTVDIRREGLGHDRDAHPLKVTNPPKQSATVT